MNDFFCLFFSNHRDCLWASIDPNTLFILSFIRCHCTVTCMIIFIFCTKVNHSTHNKEYSSWFCTFIVMFYISTIYWGISCTRSISFVSWWCWNIRSCYEITIEWWYWIWWIEYPRYGSRRNSSRNYLFLLLLMKIFFFQYF